MERWFSTVQDLSGNALASATIRVNVAGTSTLASLFSDNGITPLANPFTNNADGTFQFYAGNGRYDVLITKTGYVFPPNETAGLLLNDSIISPWLNIADYGASPAASAATNTAAIQAAHDALPATGGIIFMPAGTYSLSGTPIAVTKPATFMGAGLGSTIFTLTHATANTFVLNATEAVTFRDFRFDAAVAFRTGGACITVSSTTVNYQTLIERVFFANQYNGVVFTRAAIWQLRDCYFNTLANDGIQVDNLNNPDEGDSTISGCQFANITRACVLQSASGGLRVYDNKFNSCGYGYAMDLTGSTVDLLFEANSVENCTIAGVSFLRTAGVATFANAILTGNQFAIAMNSVPDISIGTAGTWFQNLVITGNVSTQNNNSQIFAALTGGSVIQISGNTVWQLGATGVGVSLAVGATEVVINPNNFIVSTPIGTPNATTTVFDTRVAYIAANLPAAMANGSLVYCTDCTLTNPCAGGGTGAFARRINAAWVCT